MKRVRYKLFIAICLVLSLMCFPLSTFAETASMENESSRVVTVYKIDGIVTVTRDDGSHPGVFVGTELRSGDLIEVEKDSRIYLKIDNDKYVMADGSTVFSIDVSGTAKDSETKINLTSGSIINRVDQKLSRNSSYEIITPNSTTAIRGTLVRTKTMSNPNQTQTTSTQVFEGLVEMYTVKPDGSIYPTLVRGNQSQTQTQESDLAQDPAQGYAQKLELNSSETVNLTNNQKLQITQDQSFEIITGIDGQMKTVTKTIDYRKLSPEAIQFLIDSTETGRKLPKTKEELEVIKKEAIEEREEEEFQTTYTYYGLFNSSSDKNTTAGDLSIDIPGEITEEKDKEDPPSEIDVPLDEKKLIPS